MIRQVVLRDELDSRAYFLIGEKTKSGFLIDTGSGGDKLAEIIRFNGWNIEKIILTHGHFDHIGAAEYIREKTGARVLIHKNGEKLLGDPTLNLSAFFGRPFTVSADAYFEDGDLIASELDPSVSLKVVYTPGHTDDSCIFVSDREKAAFTGDTIFKNSFGAYHFPTGDFKLLMNSIKNRVLTLPDGAVLYSGHSDATTVGAERKNFF